MQSSVKVAPSVREIAGRADAERALAKALSRPGNAPRYAALFLAGHISRLLEDGDAATADRAMVAYVQDLIHALRPGDVVYRWSGSSLLVLLDRDTPPGMVRAEVERLPVFGVREVVNLRQHRSIGGLCWELDIFVAQHI